MKLHYLTRTLVFGGMLACTQEGASAQTSFGDPLPGLTPAEQTRFLDGKEEFLAEETIEEGLGPVFNGTACGNCHSVPATGGGSTIRETRFGQHRAGSFRPMEEAGGSLIQRRGIGVIDTCNYVGEVVPQTSNRSALRRSQPLFGLGLVDAVLDQAFKDIAAEPGEVAVGGTVHMVQNLSTGGLSVGKFGWKAQVPNLFQFSGDAYLNEMGITNPQFPDESCPQGDCTLLACNPVPELNDDGTGVDKFFDFMTFLAPPPRGPITPDVTAGEQLFQDIGCTSCHRPTLTTDPAYPVAALQNVTFHPYSDFLLHDMGNLGDGITQNDATGALMRTAPLWGLREIQSFLHDGRATTVEDAIKEHQGQGKAARNAFMRLKASAQQLVLAFLNSL